MLRRVGWLGLRASARSTTPYVLRRARSRSRSPCAVGVGVAVAVGVVVDVRGDVGQATSVGVARPVSVNGR
ncbi:hypothetical protein FAIPA1_550019 [Frankia sp. AiPs1]